MAGKTKKVLLTTGTLIIAAGIWLVSSSPDALEDQQTTDKLPLSNMLQGKTDEQFDSAIKIRSLEFPRDHGPHPAFQTEWWYFTGNLSNDDNTHYGYQFTIFRRSFSREKLNLDSDWAANQVYLAHVGITDVNGNEYFVDEMLSRDVLGLAGAQANPFSVWVENWVVEGVPGECEGCLNLSIRAQTQDFVIDLELNSVKPVVLQGEQGLSRKSNTPGNASYYYSLTRLQTSGEITIRGITEQVSGTSWMDHEWFSSVLDTNQAGWDWFSLQLNDQRELMLFQIRPIGSAKHSFKYGILVHKQGETQPLNSAEIALVPLREWQSKSSETRYPVHWQVTIPELNAQLDIEALLDKQERDASFRYWEGAVKVRGHQGTLPITGYGYLEMTGY